jgi:hypothetical protein
MQQIVFILMVVAPFVLSKGHYATTSR